MREARRDTFARKYCFELIVGRIERSIEKFGDGRETRPFLSNAVLQVAGMIPHHPKYVLTGSRKP